MPTAWYLCPYDVSVVAGRVQRKAAIARYLPSIPNPDGSLWDEAETLGNHLLVKVIAPDGLQTTIRSDPDFLVIPHLLPEIPPPRRAMIRHRLLGFGYTAAEIDSTGWKVVQLLALLTSASTRFQRRQDGSGIDILPGRFRSRKTAAQIEARLPG